MQVQQIEVLKLLFLRVLSNLTFFWNTFHPFVCLYVSAFVWNFSAEVLSSIFNEVLVSSNLKRKEAEILSFFQKLTQNFSDFFAWSYNNIKF